MIVKKSLFTGVEIALVVAFLFGAGSSIKNFKDRKAIKELSALNVEQSTKIKNLVFVVEETNKKKDEITDKKIEVEKELKTKAAEGFSILFEQAVDINKENATTFTSEHVATAQNYVELWGYQAMASVIKWQQGAIMKQIEQSKQLMEKNTLLEKQYDKAKLETQQEIDKTKKLTIEHEKTAISLQNKAKEFISANDRIIFWVMVIGGGYLFITLGGAGWLRKVNKDAVAAAEHYKRKNNAAIRAIKTFSAVDDIGNDMLTKIIDQSDEVELVEDDLNDDPVKTHRQAKKKVRNAKKKG